MAMHWVGAGANLLEGGDLAQADALGRKLLHDPAVHGVSGVADQFGGHPMQPRNPHAASCPPHWPFNPGAGNPQQLQAWIAGPSAATGGDALVILSNLGQFAAAKEPHAHWQSSLFRWLRHAGIPPNEAQPAAKQTKWTWLPFTKNLHGA